MASFASSDYAGLDGLYDQYMPPQPLYPNVDNQPHPPAEPPPPAYQTPQPSTAYGTQSIYNRDVHKEGLFNYEVAEALDDIKDLAAQILGGRGRPVPLAAAAAAASAGRKDGGAPTYIYNDYRAGHLYSNYPVWGSSWFTPFWGSRTVHHHTTVVHNYPSPTRSYSPASSDEEDGKTGKKKKKDNGTERLVVGAVAMAVGGAAVYLLGQEIGRFQGAGDDQERIHQLNRRLNTRREALRPDHPHISRMNRMFSIAERIYGRIQKDAMVNGMIRTAFLGAAILGLSGAFFDVSWALNSCYVLGTVTTMGQLFKWGFNSMELTNKREAREMRTLYNEVNSIQYRIDPFPPADTTAYTNGQWQPTASAPPAD